MLIWLSFSVQSTLLHKLSILAEICNQLSVMVLKTNITISDGDNLFWLEDSNSVKACKSQLLGVLNLRKAVISGY